MVYCTGKVHWHFGENSDRKQHQMEIIIFSPKTVLEFLQMLILKKFPAILIITFYITFFSAIQSGVYSLAMVKDPSAWKLRLDIGLFAVLYSVST